jgi:hypothetical protein
MEMDIPTVPINCGFSLMMREAELRELLDKIAKYTEYEQWIRDLVDECLTDTEDEYMQLLMDNRDRLEEVLG